MEVQNKIVMITGASKGMGKAVALTFAKAGANLAISARSKDLIKKPVSIARLG